jgi:RHS repeat-associated protein
MSAHAAESIVTNLIRLAEKRFRLVSLLAIGTLLFWSLSCFGLDKSGATSSAISLPAGPGSIEGLGESFEPNLNTGMAQYSVSLELPPGTAGHMPSLSLQYDAGGGASVVGFGWRLVVPFVQRQTDKGIPRYVDDDDRIDNDGDGTIDDLDEADVFINEVKEELIQSTEGFYFCRNEGAFIRYKKQGDYWEGTMPNGVRLLFGITSASRITDSSSGKVFRWLLDRVIDTNGNSIEYGYEEQADDHNLNQKYLSHIAYGPGSSPWQNFHFVKFEYENRPDWFEDARSGFLIRTGKRLRQVIVGTQGGNLAGHASGDFNADGVSDNLNRKYLLNYESDPHWSLLTSVTWIGADNESTYPPVSFTYTRSDPKDVIDASGAMIGSDNAPPQVMDNAMVDLVDLNQDGVPDLLKTELGGQHRGYLNLGERDVNGKAMTHWSAPIPLSSEDGLAWQINLGDLNVIAHLADQDGDGAADLTYRSAVGEVYYFRNLGAVGWGARERMNVDPTDAAPPSPFGSPNVRSADLDFDKRMDVIQSISVGNEVHYRIWFNRGTQRFSKSATVPQESGFAFSNAGVYIGDFNGDRVPDIVRIRPTRLEITAGLGYGRFAPLVSVALPDWTLTDSQIANARLQDLSGDGLLDLVIDRPSPGEVWYWLNLGNYTLDKRRRITGIPIPAGTNPEIRWVDLNANGTTDLVFGDSALETRIQSIDIGRLMGCEPHPHLLKTIENGIGRKTEIGYATTTHFLQTDVANGRPWKHPLPFPVDVVAQVVTDDSNGNRYVTEFTYHDGHYNGKTKEFRGFQEVEKREVGDSTAPDLVLAYQFDVGVEEESLKGKVRQIAAKTPEGFVFYIEQNTWQQRVLIEGRKGKTVHFASQSAKKRTVVEGGKGDAVEILWEYEYDDVGNITRQIEHGRLDAGWDDERVTNVSYTAQYPSGRTTWNLRQIVDKTTTDERGSKITHQKIFYDGSLTTGEITLGNVTRIEDWVSDNRYVTSARHEYDSFGNIVATYDPLYGAAVGHARTFLFDEKFHAYPVEEKIATGSAISPLVYRARYDAGFGTVQETTNFNGFTTRYSYDPFGRLISLTKAPDVSPTMEYEYGHAQRTTDGKVVNWIETRQRDSSEGDGFRRSRTYSDGLGRLLLNRAESGKPGEIVVSGAVEFNDRQGPRKIYPPYYENGTLEYSAPLSVDGYTAYSYDALGRQVQIQRPVKDGRIPYSAFDYAPLLRTITDEEQTDPTSTHFGSGLQLCEDGLLNPNGTGRVRRTNQIVKLSDGGERLITPVIWSTSYEYDLRDNLLAVIDPQGNRRSVEYDGLGRKTFIHDPDRGDLQYIYDDASNTARTVDGKQQNILFEYDGLNRLISEQYVDGNLASTPVRESDVLYFYDSVQTNSSSTTGLGNFSSNARGYPVSIRDASGEEHFSYDEKGRVRSTTKLLRNQKADSWIPYVTEFEYDALDHLISIKYPDDTTVRYAYDARGFVKTVQLDPNLLIVSGIDYDAAGREVRRSFGNGIVSTRDFDAQFRLKVLKTFSASDSTHPLLAYGYTYDNVGNIQRIEDLRDKNTIEAGDPRRNTQEFTYDDLYRLVGAKYSFAAPAEAVGDNGSIAYRYDRIGNMLSMKSDIDHFKNGYSITNVGDMTYGGSAGASNRQKLETGSPPGPRALTATDNGSDKRSIAYDGNGNVELLEGNFFRWDFRNRLSFVTNSNVRAEYLYDYANRRVIKILHPGMAVEGAAETESASITEYVNQYYDIREGKPLRYVYLGGTRIAEVAGEASQLELTYRHDDHLTSSSVVTNANGEVTNWIAYYPYGEIRLETKEQAKKTNFTYLDREQDTETGHFLLGSRYYSPILARFLSVDPLLQDVASYVGQPLAGQAYAYGRGNPLSYADPEGLAEEPIELVASSTKSDAEIWGFVQDAFGDTAYWVPSSEGNVFIYARATPQDFAEKVAVIRGIREVGGAETLGRISAAIAVEFATGGATISAVGSALRNVPRLGTAGMATVRGLLSRVGSKTAIEGGEYIVYRSVNPITKLVDYVGITKDFAKRETAHLVQKGIQIEQYITGLSKAEARAVEQVLIESHGMFKNGGALLNRINSIAKSNPIYESAISRGKEILKMFGD